jgi:hypothetical protein
MVDDSTYREHVTFLKKARDRAERIAGHISNRFEGVTKKMVRTGAVLAGAGAGGIIQGHAGPKGSHIAGLPTDLVLGLGFMVGGYANAAGKRYSEHLSDVGDGLLASFVSSVGFGWGNTWRETGKFQFGASKTAELPAGAAVKGEIHPQQMADIVARVQAAAARGPG